MQIVSWNVNSIKVRSEHVLDYIDQTSPDFILLQELKGIDFPAKQFENHGYTCTAVTQKAYNGVAVLGRQKYNVIHDALPGDKKDTQARYLEIVVNSHINDNQTPWHLINIYLPNGNPYGSENYTYKCAWMERLYDRIRTLRDDRIPFIIGGDFNVIPDAIDCHDPKVWQNDALYHLNTRKIFKKICNLGLTDAYRINNIQPQQYTFWDYQGGAWQRNNGIRIDHFLMSPTMADLSKRCIIDKDQRAKDRPSDHTPIRLELNIEKS